MSKKNSCLCNYCCFSCWCSQYYFLLLIIHFSDVPADSWAYDAVTTLAADGVIDGYPDGTYKGQNTMTRYEMAQIVARAMAKTDLEKS